MALWTVAVKEVKYCWYDVKPQTNKPYRLNYTGTVILVLC